jgi:CheY-like chemotaxis protein
MNTPTSTACNRCSSFARAVTAGAAKALAPGGTLKAERSAPLRPRPLPKASRNEVPCPECGSPAGKRVLIVEDDDLTREMLRAILQAEGYRIEGVANGREALARLRGEAAPDLILLDLLMPVMTGWEFCAAVAEDPRLASIPVVILSAIGPEEVEREPPLHPAARLRKPFTVEELLAVVARC